MDGDIRSRFHRTEERRWRFYPIVGHPDVFGSFEEQLALVHSQSFNLHQATWVDDIMGSVFRIPARQ